jgi:DNA (cytosine-5)-methyltransferase 1
MRAIDFYCGAGGLTRGLINVGIQVTAGIDADGRCHDTFEKNNSGARFFERDIRQVSANEVWRILGSRATRDLLFAGCAPCQPFSKQRKKGSEAQQRHLPDATLLSAFAALVESIRPAHVMIENVPGLAKVPGYSTYRRFLRMLQANGYQVADGVVDAKHYGVPQNRRRYILLASKVTAPQLPSRTYGPGVRPFRTVEHAISHYPPIAAGESHSLIPNHAAAALSETNLKRIRSTPRNGGDRRQWAKELRLECHKGEYEGHTDVYGRMRWEMPAPTLTGRCNSLSNGRYGHPDQDRAISLREAASLQSFSDAYVFYGTNQHIARQIGNAVPVRLAEALGCQIALLRRD